MGYINDLLRISINYRNRRRLKNKEISLISSNCNGTFILHDLGLQFKSPFVNLWIGAKDYIKLLKHLDEYLKCELSFIEEECFINGIKVTYPIGILKDIKIYFQHYCSKEEALEKWKNRLERFNKDNLFILFTDRDGCTYEDLVEFDNLPYKNKIVFTHKNYPELKSAIYLKKFRRQEEVGACYEFRHKFSGKRVYDIFDYVEWFNSGENDNNVDYLAQK